MEDFYRFSGVNLRDRIISDFAKYGGLSEHEGVHESPLDVIKTLPGVSNSITERIEHLLNDNRHQGL